MFNISRPEESGSYSLGIKETSGCFAFLRTFVSALLNKDIFIDSFLSRDVFPNISIFLEQFQDKLDEKMFGLLENIPAVLSLAITSITLTSLASIFFLGMLYYQYRQSTKGEPDRRSVEERNSKKERGLHNAVLCVLVCVCLCGCVWVVCEARMVNRGVTEIPEVS